ncbi:MAG: 3'-5' exonuclease [Patescibacteria group bacterium]
MLDFIKKEEEIHLNNTINELIDGKRALDQSLKEMGAGNLSKLEKMRKDVDTDPHDLLIFMEQMHHQNVAFNFKDKFARLEELESLLKEPYFARIDLQNTSEKTKKVYIGKFGYNDGQNSIVTDWRAKIASVFYRYRYPQKNVEYNTPDGTVVENLKLKRTFEIDEGKLIKYYNNDLQLDENEIIQKKIEERSGGVLEDIIETIQESQLDIIEADPRQICIVQGCVGSGKSTVAIHKLSHIFFNYPELIHAERSILIAKNQILVGYLSTLFPKLGIFNLGYGTVRDLLVRLLFQEELPINVDLGVNLDTSDFSLARVKALDSVLHEVHSEFEQKIDELFSKEEYVSFGGFVYDSSVSVYENLTELIDELEEEATYQQESAETTTNPSRRLLFKANAISIKKILRQLRKLRTSVKTTYLPSYVKKLIGQNINEYGYLETILYVLIVKQLLGFSKFRKFEYCVIDEGQDFSPLEYCLLGKLVINGRFCILGDLNQSYTKDGLTNWEVIAEVIDAAKSAATFELDTNYRSTKPIIDLANSVIGSYTDQYLPKSIDRAGEPPKILTTTNTNELLSTFKTSLEEDIKDLNKSIGVICMTSNLMHDAENIINSLNLPEGKFIKLDSSKRVHYIPQGVYLTDFSNCKGLEFAKVYVLGLSLEDDVKSFVDAKRAFVAITRAMNELTLLC